MASKPNPPVIPTGNLTVKQLRDFVANSRWIFAKTMPQCPHEYTLRRQAPDEPLFEKVVMHIRAHGYRERYGKSWYIRLNLDGWKYWTMGAPLKSTILINRARLDDSASVSAQHRLPFMRPLRRKTKSR